MNREELISLTDNGFNPKYLFFWGHQPSSDGTITASCFSQWWVAPFEVNGLVFQTAEHWMMYQKAELFNDEACKAQILAATSPGEAKKLGRLVQNFDPIKWDQHKFEIVVEGNRYKFLQDEALKMFLLNTNTRILVEASPVDPVWGIGLAANQTEALNPMTWRGENLLGFALMEVRDHYLKKEKSDNN